MAFGENHSTLPAEKRSTTPAESEVFAVKRRRITLQDVENELRVAGLCQPALSLFKGSEQDDGLVVPSVVNLKRNRDQDLAVSSGADVQPFAAKEGVVQQPEFEKRRRLCAQIEPLYTAQANIQPACTAEAERCIRSNGSLVPYSVGGSYLGATPSVVVGDYSPVIPRSIDGHPTITVDPLGLTFIVGNGYLMAELPVSRRPACSWSGEQATKIVLDNRGKAFFLSEEGQILASIPAVHQLESGHDCNGKDVRLQLLSTRCEIDALPLAIRVSAEDKVAADEEVYSPSTDVPSPSADDLEEDGMDTD